MESRSKPGSGHLIGCAQSTCRFTDWKCSSKGSWGDKCREAKCIIADNCLIVSLAEIHVLRAARSKCGNATGVVPRSSPSVRDCSRCKTWTLTRLSCAEKERRGRWQEHSGRVRVSDCNCTIYHKRKTLKFYFSPNRTRSVSLVGKGGKLELREREMPRKERVMKLSLREVEEIRALGLSALSPRVLLQRQEWLRSSTLPGRKGALTLNSPTLREECSPNSGMTLRPLMPGNCSYIIRSNNTFTGGKWPRKRHRNVSVLLFFLHALWRECFFLILIMCMWFSVQ